MSEETKKVELDFWPELYAPKVCSTEVISHRAGLRCNHTETMTKISAIVCTVQLRHKSKQKHTEAQQCIIPPGFP